MYKCEICSKRRILTYIEFKTSWCPSKEPVCKRICSSCYDLCITFPIPKYIPIEQNTMYVLKKVKVLTSE